MRATGLVYAGVFVVGVTGLLERESRAQPVDGTFFAALAVVPPGLLESAPEPESIPDPESLPELESMPELESLPKLERMPEPRVEASDTPLVRERQQARASVSTRGSGEWRRGRRNRYPGPIPTPADWTPPEGPVKIALQAGHWRASEAPHELRRLRGNGTRWENLPEWQANLEIARQAGALLEEMGYEVDLLPAIVPPGYRAHLFISIHADGSGDPNASGYRVAAPSRDATGRASGIVTLLETSYGEATGLPRIPTVTRRMRNYYAFNFRRYEHALHPMTIAVIIETGFLTNRRDRGIIVDDPARAALGIVQAVAAFEETPPPVPLAGR